jgi:hypothetical protein
VIRQAISCDICGTEKRQTNHWFVAYEQAGELRISGWTSRHRMRADSKHLCGQTCLHKLVDEFMAKSIASRAKPATDEIDIETPASSTDTSLTSGTAYEEVESSARLITPSPIARRTVSPLPSSRPQPEIVTMPSRPRPEESPAAPLDPPRYASRAWHAEAWERERQRELRAIDNHPEIASRRRSNARRGV